MISIDALIAGIDDILAASPSPDREHVWAQWPIRSLTKYGRTPPRCARCRLWYSRWQGDNDCPE